MGVDEALGALDKQAVKVHVAAAQQRVVAAAAFAIAQHPGVGLGALGGGLVLRPQVQHRRGVDAGLVHIDVL